MAFLKDTEVAKIINVNVNTLRTWREKGRGPKFIKAEGKRGAVRYGTNDLNAWIEEAQNRAIS